MKYRSLALAAAAALAIATPALATPAQDFQALMDDYWASYLKNSPLTASGVEISTYDAELDVLSLAEMDRRAAEAAAFLQRLDAIPAASLSAADQSNRAILKRVLEAAVTTNRFGQRQMLYGSLDSYHANLGTMAENQPFRTQADYSNFLERLAKVPERMRSYGEISSKAAREGFVQPCSIMAGFGETVTRFVTDDPTKSTFYTPFAGQRPETISAADWAVMQQRARTLITGQVNPSYVAFAQLYERELKGECRQSVGASALPQGQEYYRWLVGQFTTTNLTPDQIHEIGLKQVAAIRADMEAVAKNTGFASREAMIADMRTNPKFYVTRPEALMEATAVITKTIDGKMPSYFTRLPRLPYGIRPMAAATAPGDTTARYQPGSPDAGIAGFYLVNLTKLDQRPLWEIPVLSVHEAVPGHHMQIATQQELDLPAWRKNTVFITAFVEGWGLYSERLGIDMGLYDTPQKEMGRLGYQMWRACRLVIDTGLHSKGWSKERAVAYMKDNSTLTDANIEAEINRYISDPGQALAYKIGQMKIEELRARAEKELGAKFDVRRFHDAVLGQGSVPMDALEGQIDTWIASEQSRA